MRITLLELVDFKCLFKSNIQHFKFKPSEVYQLILGTNGSGKSSVMSELTPWPSDPNDFTKEGYKAIELVARGSKYRLTSEFRKKVTHTFEKDGEELNPGGTTSVQKQLCTQHFGVTQETQDLLMDRERFTKMKPAEKRQWFTRLSDTNYDFAIDVYNKLSKEGRDVEGDLRRTKSRLVTEIEKVITKEEEERLEIEVNALDDEIKRLLSEHNPRFDKPHTFAEKRAKHLEKIAQFALKILKTQIVAPEGSTANCIQDIDDIVYDLNTKLSTHEGELNIHVKTHDKLDKAVNALRQAGAEGITALRNKLEPLRAERDSWYKKQRLQLVIPNPEEAQRALETVWDSLEACFDALPPNEDRRYSQGRLVQLREGREARTKDIDQGRLNIAKLVARREHMEAHKAQAGLTCPKCHHSWVSGFSDEHYAKCIANIETLSEANKLLEQEVSEIDEQIDGVVNYANTYREFTRISQNWPALMPLWDYLAEEKLVINFPSKAKGVLSIFQADLVHAQSAVRCERELEEIQRIISAASESEDENLEDALDELATVEALVHEITDRIQTIRKQISLYAGYKYQLAEVGEANVTIIRMMEESQTHTEQEIEASYHQLLSSMISNATHTMVKKRDSLQNVRQQRAVVRALEQQIEDATADDQAYKALIKELSPKEGLIAEGLLGFIRNFTGQMNHLIHKIWTYPLQVRPCGGEVEGSADLDYKFPMMVSSKTNIVPDVNRGSSGQQEIVNLAFKVVSMRYMDMADFPLFLDEFGASFDEAHRNSAMSVVKTLMEQQSFSQLFMVSHYEGNHGALTNAEVMVLCPQNITVPAKYNQHVELN